MQTQLLIEPMYPILSIRQAGTLTVLLADVGSELSATSHKVTDRLIFYQFRTQSSRFFLAKGWETM
jgi:hypothetical protein